MTSLEDALQRWRQAVSQEDCVRVVLAENKCSPLQLLQQMQTLLQALSNEPALPSQGWLDCPLPEQSLSSWLPLLEQESGLLWTERDHRWWCLGLGWLEQWQAADWSEQKEVFAHLQRRLERWPEQPQVFGGHCFGETLRSTSRWQETGAVRFGLPQLFLQQKPSGTSLRLLWDHPTPQQGLQSLQTLVERAFVSLKTHNSNTTILVGAPTHNPERTGWFEALERAKEAFASTALTKVVLARETSWRLKQAFPLASVLQRLVEEAPDTFVFSFRWKQGHPAFFGATPERLFKREGLTLYSEALAGTRRRGKTSEEDKALGQELLNSTKDRYEQRLVFDDLHGLFSELCEEVEGESEPRLRQLQTVQHLYSPLRGRLCGSSSDVELLPRFHPTPAVGGRPRKLALEHLRELERFERGWYAAPVGWWSANASEWAVAIRSGLLLKEEFVAFAGAGIVPDSDNQGEWDELNHKLRPLSRLLTVVPTTEEDVRA